MKLQHFIIIFLIIMLPVVLVMSEYTTLQIDTLSKKTQYDTALLGATSDTVSAFELNTINNESSSVVGEEIRDLEAVISTFTNSLSTSLNMTGVNNDYILSYVPAMVFTMYDGYYIYSGNDSTKEKELKPYIYYTKTYSNGVGTNITISFSLDNYVSIYGTYGGKSISAAGYLIVPDDVAISNKFTYVTTTKDDGSMGTKVIDPGGLSKITYKGLEIGEETIYENEPITKTDGSNGVNVDVKEETTDAMMYYYEAKKFTEIYNNVISNLNITDQAILKIDRNNDPEDENSAFMNEKIDVIKDSITKSLNTAIYNYEGGVSENYEMPQLNGEDWDKILNNLSTIAFLKDIPIGSTTYNNYVVINSTTNKKYVSAKSIDFIAYDTDGKSSNYFHEITCDNLKKKADEGMTIVGYASVDFERYKYASEESETYYYYYKHNEYADYACKMESTKIENVATVTDNINDETLLKAYYSAVGRIRYRLVKASSYINIEDSSHQFKINYYSNGGQWSDGSISKTTTISNGKVNIMQKDIPYKNGYSFVGWSINTNGSADIKVGDTLYLENDEINLYAVWAQQYTIQYINGENEILNETKLSDIDYNISTIEPTPTENQIFVGWTDGNKIYKPGEVYDRNQDLQLKAVWTDKLVTIKYFDTFGNSKEEQKVYNASINLNGAGLNLTRDGQEFLGWTTKTQAREVEYALGAVYSGEEDLKLYAVWKVKSYKITYDANGGDELTSDYQNETKTYGLPYTIVKTPIPTKSGYTFLGWSTDQNALTAEYKSGDLLEINDNITLYAVWEGSTYAIEYDANGGENAPQKVEGILKNTDTIISNQKPTRTGYDFVGWGLNKYATEEDVAYNPGDTYTKRTGIKLFAIWKVKVYTIEYVVDGNVIATQSKTYGKSIQIISNVPEKEDNVFAGWGTSVTGNAQYKQNDTFNNDSLLNGKDKLTFYAIWGNESIVLSIYPNGGTYQYNGAKISEYKEIVVKPGTSITISIPTQDTYLGVWQEQETGSSSGTTISNVNNGYQTITVGNKDVSIVAYWSNNYYNLTFYDAISNKILETRSVEARTLIEDLPTFSKSGYTFLGWSTRTDGSVLEYTNEYYMSPEDVTLTAVWVKNNYTIIFDAKGGTLKESEKTKEVTYNQTYGSLPTPTRLGYIFTGWYLTSEEITGVDQDGNFIVEQVERQITEKTIVSAISEHTLYAKWEKGTILTYNVNGGTWSDSSTGSKQYTVKIGGSTTIISAVPKKSGGYTFLGWSTNSSATSAEYEAGATITMNEDITLYAVYKTATVQSIELSLTETQWIARKTLEGEDDLNYFEIYATAIMSKPTDTAPNINWSIGSSSTIKISSSTSSSGSNGKIIVTAKEAGGTYITATVDGISTTLQVKVYNVKIKGATTCYQLTSYSSTDGYANFSSCSNYIKSSDGEYPVYVISGDRYWRTDSSGYEYKGLYCYVGSDATKSRALSHSCSSNHRLYVSSGNTNVVAFYN